MGTIGDVIREFDIVLASGDVKTCSREANADLFHAAVGGFGMLGTFSRIVLETKRVYSGDLDVEGISTRNLREMMDAICARTSQDDYLVAWVDCFANDDGLGRGLIHAARYLEEGVDPDPERTLAIDHQELPSKILGVVPKSEVWRALRLFNNDSGMRTINAAKFFAGRLEGMKGAYRQSHAAFAFLLDYVPNWKWAYGRTDREGLIQYQAFLPKETAYDVYREILVENQRASIVPYLGVFKRHRPDPFWLTHSNDGWSFALDYKVTNATRDDLWKHCARLTEIVLAGGGKFYFAKDLVIGQRDMLRMFPPEKTQAFLAMKRALDPEMLLQTNLYRRIFAGLEP
jgi:FAD/FMN-containing dehydrogenase